MYAVSTDGLYNHLCTLCPQTACQDQRETDEDDSEYDEMLIEYAGDVVPSLGRALPTDHFIQVFMDLYPQLLSKTVSLTAPTRQADRISLLIHR